jgi:predicted flap endonuclease-1-like 5' DNA nuclease
MNRAQPIARVVGEDRAHDFKSVRVRTTTTLFDRGKKLADRNLLSKQTGLAPATILEFVTAADLMRVNGISMVYVTLLRAAGVFTVRELRCRNPENLFMMMAEANARARLVRFLPAIGFVHRWIRQAKELPLEITYR